MNKVIRLLENMKTKVAQVDPALAGRIDDVMEEADFTTNPMVNDLQNPKIESFARPRPEISLKSDDGTLHSFSVEIKAKHNGPIPDTQLMSKILQSIESHADNVTEFAAGDKLDNSFEVVSFKYERRDDKKNAK
jgi:hypothetical protein